MTFNGKKFLLSCRDINSFQNRVTLDSDAQEGYGAETITVSKMNATDTYRLLIHKYSKVYLVSLDQQAKLSVYFDGRLDRIVSLPKTNNTTAKIRRLKSAIIEFINKPVDKI